MYTDLGLSRRLEVCEGKTNAAFVDARARLDPESGAAHIECAGAHVLFDGVGSPLTQTFGLGLTEVPTDEDMERIEVFFRERGSEVFHEVSPISGNAMLELLTARGYRPIELTSVMYRLLDGSFTAQVDEGPVRARFASSNEMDLWAETAAEGWSSESAELSTFIRDFARITASSEGTYALFAELDGTPVGTGAVAIHDGIALLAGASTIPAARKQGAQRALLQARLGHAVNQGCDLAMMCAAPGSASQRNAERQGFRIAYTRIKWASAPTRRVPIES